MKRGEIWLVNLDPTIGAEIKKQRPAIIVSIDQLGKLPLKIIVPLTDWKSRYEIAPWMVKIYPTLQNGLSKASAADCFQVRSISELRLIKRIGVIHSENLHEISQALSLVLKIPPK
jgi:mRNA interferase MazF